MAFDSAASPQEKDIQELDFIQQMLERFGKRWKGTYGNWTSCDKGWKAICMNLN